MRREGKGVRVEAARETGLQIGVVDEKGTG